MYICETCGINYEKFADKANHVRWKHLDNTEFIKNLKKHFEDKAKLIIWVEEDIKCNKKNCNNLIHIKYKEGKKKEKYYCSKSCANSRTHSTETRKKQRDSLIKAWKNGAFDTEQYKEKRK